METAKDGTVWREERVGAPLPFTPIVAYAAHGEPTPAAKRSISSRLESFLRFITLDMLHSIQECTIQHARRTEHDDWFMDIPELMAFISIVILRGAIRLPSPDDYWSEEMGVAKIMATMAHERFEDIMRHLRFDDRSTRRQRVKTDKFAAISDVWGPFVANCVTSYNPGPRMSVDTLLLPTKSRCCFLQYVPTTLYDEKFGIKFWVACDLKTKYICNVLPCLAADPTSVSGEDVVMHLMKPFLNQGRHVATDSCLTSLSLAQRLLSHKTTFLGAVDKNRSEIPDSSRQRARKKYTTQVFSTAGATLTAYVYARRKTVRVLSSDHSVVHTEDSYRNRPDTVTRYNATKFSMDVLEQKLRRYSVRMETRRWPVAVFYNMIDMAALNAYVLYQACTGGKERRGAFLLALATELANPHVGGVNT
ncbi:uncharacterized protein LOC121201908 [Betta splendens]|uniref:Uncharacterized protein LOC121201908 n=1 Tax=Betta splendens TaxID=158456 RepID=A0A8M1H8L3_BETSP|nr:uncharacterized protein LOC121201908 [Betta splendens]